MRIAATFTNETRHQLAEAYREYLKTLPPKHRELAMAIMTADKTVVVRRNEIPRRILEDDEFFYLFLAHLKEIAKKWRG